MKIRTDFVTNSSSSSFLAITITKTDGTNIILEDENRCFMGLGDFECATVRDLYDALVEGFEGEIDGIGDFLDQVLEIGNIDAIASMKIEDSTTSWEGDIEDPVLWEDQYDDIEYDEENGMITGTDTYFYIIKNGTATLVEHTFAERAPKYEAGAQSIQFAREISPLPEQIEFSGKNFVHTSCDDDELLDTVIKSKGGVVRSSTVKTTNYLIIGNKVNHRTGKILRALEWNAKGQSIVAMTEYEFWGFASDLTPAPNTANSQNSRSRSWEGLFEPRILERGRDYAASGKVSNVQRFSEVRAEIQGRDRYEVSIVFNEAHEIWGTYCTCPHAQEGHNCKHIAAVLYEIDFTSEEIP